VIFDIHMENHRDFNPKQPAFDVLVCAGDVYNDIVVAMGMVRAIAGKKLAIFVAGNHEYWGDMTESDAFERGHAYAQKCGVLFLERGSFDISGVRFAGATLWDEGDERYWPAVEDLAVCAPDVVVTHYPPPALALVTVGARLWIHGHHHGHSDIQAGRTRVVRNSGYPGEPVPEGVPAREDFVVEI
jgi:calcineurin-like phosphoesterase family protein